MKVAERFLSSSPPPPSSSSYAHIFSQSELRRHDSELHGETLDAVCMEEKEEERVVGGKRPSIAEIKYVHCIMVPTCVVQSCMFVSIETLNTSC